MFFLPGHRDPEDRSEIAAWPSKVDRCQEFGFQLPCSFERYEGHKANGHERIMKAGDNSCLQELRKVYLIDLEADEQTALLSIYQEVRFLELKCSFSDQTFDMS
jgi:hypothetical protein